MRIELCTHDRMTVAAIYAHDGRLLGRGYGMTEAQARDDAIDDFAEREALKDAARATRRRR